MDIDLWKQTKKQLKLTFDDLSAMTNLSVRTLKSLFSGERTNATTYTVQAIEKALGLDKESTTDISDEEKNFLLAFRQLTEQEKKEFLTIAEFILAKRQ